MRRFIRAVFITMMLLTIGQAQVPPAWNNIGDLPGANHINYILGIPGTNVLIACGGNESKIYRSSNGGQSWTQVFFKSGTPIMVQLVRDSISGRIWAFRNTSGANVLYFSNDTGQTWTGVSGPISNPATLPYRIEIIGDYVYFGGNVASPYSTCLYRLHQTTLQWEMVFHYPQCNVVNVVKYYNGKLIVIAKDLSQTFNRVFTHTLTDLDKQAIPIGKAVISETTTKQEK